jgi:hypothetical protein
MLSSHLRLDLPSGVLPSGLPTKMLMHTAMKTGQQKQIIKLESQPLQ